MARREKRKRCPVRFATSALVPCQFGERIGGTCLIWAQTRTPRPGSVSHVLWMTWRLCRLVVGVDSVRVWTETEGDFGRREMGVSEDALAFCENYVTVIKTDALCSNQFSSLFCCFEIWGFSIFIYLFIFIFYYWLPSSFMAFYVHLFKQRLGGRGSIIQIGLVRKIKIYFFLFFFARVTIENKERKWANISL